MRVLVTGATGFTGSYTVPLLLEQGFEVRCLARHSSAKDVLSDHDIEWVIGDVADRDSLIRALDGIDILVNIVSLGFGHASNIVHAAVKTGVSRAIFVSTTSLFTSLNAPSKAIRQAAEQEIARSGLAYTILRPTMIYGSARDRNMCRLVRYLRRWPLIPVFGNGHSLQQPVYVGDVASSLVKVLNVAQTIGKAYNISGAAPITYNQVIDTISELLGRKVMRVHIPVGPVLAGLTILEKLHIRLPIKVEQIRRLNENKVFDYTEASRDFDYRPLSFREGISLELKDMGIL